MTAIYRISSFIIYDKDSKQHAVANRYCILYQLNFTSSILITRVDVWLVVGEIQWWSIHGTNNYKLKMCELYLHENRWVTYSYLM